MEDPIYNSKKDRERQRQRQKEREKLTRHKLINKHTKPNRENIKHSGKTQKETRKNGNTCRICISILIEISFGVSIKIPLRFLFFWY